MVVNKCFIIIFINFNTFIPSFQFLGTWYEIQRSDSPEEEADCASFEISSSNGVINVFYNGVNNNFQENSQGTATVGTEAARLTLDIGMFNGGTLFLMSFNDNLLFFQS